MEQTLLLNASYEPLQIVPWQKAVTLFCRGAAEIVAEHDREIRSVKFTIKMPAVIRLLRFVRVRMNDVVPFTRQNVFARDGYHCAYCDERFSDRDLTLDHVVPVAQGGSKSWDNIVSACQPCNRKKADQTPEQAGMVLRRQPHRPTKTMVLLRVSLGTRATPHAWRPFLYVSVE